MARSIRTENDGLKLLNTQLEVKVKSQDAEPMKLKKENERVKTLNRELEVNVQTREGEYQRNNELEAEVIRLRERLAESEGKDKEADDQIRLKSDKDKTRDMYHSVTRSNIDLEDMSTGTSLSPHNHAVHTVYDNEDNNPSTIIHDTRPEAPDTDSDSLDDLTDTMAPDTEIHNAYAPDLCEDIARRLRSALFRFRTWVPGHQDAMGKPFGEQVESWTTLNFDIEQILTALERLSGVILDIKSEPMESVNEEEEKERTNCASKIGGNSARGGGSTGVRQREGNRRLLESTNHGGDGSAGGGRDAKRRRMDQ